MGINGLMKFLKDNFPEAINTVLLEKFHGERIAIDTSMYLYKYISVCNESNWIDLFINLICSLRKNNIRPIFIFDGKASNAKNITKKERHDLYILAKAKKEKLALLMDEFENDPSDTVKNKIASELKVTTVTYKIISDAYKKAASLSVTITEEHVQLLKNLLNVLGIPWLQAVGEADKSCSWLCHYNYVKAVLSGDSDQLALGTPITIRDISTMDDTVEIIIFENLLNIIGLSKEQFQNFCILIGTDYNKRLKSYGPVKSYKTILQDNLQDNLQDIIDPIAKGEFKMQSIDKYCELFEMQDQEFKIPFLKAPVLGGLDYILNINNSKYKAENVIKMLNYECKFKII
jgi:flap endonuclease-1